MESYYKTEKMPVRPCEFDPEFSSSNFFSKERVKCEMSLVVEHFFQGIWKYSCHELYGLVYVLIGWISIKQTILNYSFCFVMCDLFQAEITSELQNF